MGLDEKKRYKEKVQKKKLHAESSCMVVLFLVIIMIQILMRISN